MITKEPADSYIVRNQGEAARIFILSGQKQDHDGPRTWGYISIISSFGNFGHLFSHCGPRPFEEFLAGLDCSYLMGKFMGLGVNVFDVDATERELKRRVIEKRRARDIEGSTAREIFDALTEAAHSTNRDEFMRTLERECEREFWEWEMYEYAGSKLNPQARGFWDRLWQPFVSEVLRPAKAAA